MSDKHPIEQEVLDDYTKRFEAYIRVCHLMVDVDKEIYEVALKKAAGQKMMMDYLTDNNILPPRKSKQ